MIQNLWKHFTWFFNKYGPDEEAGRAGDFTTTPHVLILAILTIGIGAISGVVALVLLRLINFFRHGSNEGDTFERSSSQRRIA